MDLDLTIAICAHDAAKRLPKTLEATGQMRPPPGLRWECLLIDNCSTDGTSAIAEEIGHRQAIPLRVVSEPIPGQTHARRKAVEVARGEILSYIDDDNIVDPQWATHCVAFFKAHPRAGVVGGRIDAIFEDPASRPPDFETRFATALAIRNFGDVDRQLVPPADDPPCGAGMTGRTALFRQVLLDIGCQLHGRRGKALTSGEDTEMGLLILKLGWEAWYTPGLRMGHVLPPSRLTVQYLDKLIAGGASASAWLDYLRGKEPRRSRLGYLRTWAQLQLLAEKMSLLGKLRAQNHPHSQRYPFWSALYRGQAAGYLELTLSNPARRLDAALTRVRAANPPMNNADPADNASREAVSQGSQTS